MAILSVEHVAKHETGKSQKIDKIQFEACTGHNIVQHLILQTPLALIGTR
jgi:hypothetical protein